MAETVKKSRIVSEADDLEESLMEEFNLRLKSCMSNDNLQDNEEEEEEEREQQPHVYENVQVVKTICPKNGSSPEKLTPVELEPHANETSSQDFIQIERENYYEELNGCNVHAENGLNNGATFLNGYEQKTCRQDGNEQVTSPDHMELIQFKTDLPMIPTACDQNADQQTQVLIIETNESQETIKDEHGPQYENVQFKMNVDRPNQTCSPDNSEELREDDQDMTSVKKRMFLSTDDTSCLLFTQTVTSPMLTPTEENIDFLKGLRRDSTQTSTDNTTSNGSATSEPVHDPVKSVKEETENEAIEKIYENAEFLRGNSEQRIYENLQFLKDEPNETISSIEDNNSQPEEDTSSNLIDSTPNLIEQIEEVSGDIKQQTAKFIESELFSDSGCYPVENVSVIENQDIITDIDDLEHNDFFDVEAVKISELNVDTSVDSNENFRGKSPEVCTDYVKALKTHFMQPDKREIVKSPKLEDRELNELKSLNLMKQISKFEQNPPVQDSTNVCSNRVSTTVTSQSTFVETTTEMKSTDDKSLKKKKSKKSKKDSEKENISVCEPTNANDDESIYNVNVKNLCRSFGDLTRLDDNEKRLPRILNDKKLRTKSMSDVPTRPVIKKIENVFSGVSVRALRDRFNIVAANTNKEMLASVRSIKRSQSGPGNYITKSSFSKFDALQKKNVLHVRSSDAAKAQEKFSGSQIETSNCKACEKPVFQMEQMKAERSIWHKNCFRCTECNKQLLVDSFESHEGLLFCKPHFRALFAPKVVEDEVPPSDKPDLGLEELHSLNVKERFQVFEHQNADQNQLDRNPSPVNVKKSPSILSKLARFQAKGMDVGVTDDSLNGIPIEESASEEEEEDLIEGEDADLIRAKRVQKEKPFHFVQMSDVKSKWEHVNQNNKDERREERKQELQSIRNRLFLGKQEKMKEAYQQAIMEAEAKSVKKTDPIEVTDTRSIKERFERGDIINEEIKNRESEDMTMFENGISKKSRSIFLELDANSSKAPPLSPLSPSTALGNKIRNARDSVTPERDVQHDPDIIRADDYVEDSVIAKETHTATKMLSKFRQMEESLSKDQAPAGLKPLKRFTPPREPARREVTSEEEESGSEEESEASEDAVDRGRLTDSDLLEAQKAARAKQLRAKFERWETNEIKREQNNSAVNIAEEVGEDQSQIESTRSLRARFESMRETTSTQRQAPRVVKVNRFVDTANQLEICQSCNEKVYPLEKVSLHGHIYHKNCFRCKECNSILRMDTYTYNQGLVYCIPHFKRLFISKGNYDTGFGLEQRKEKWNLGAA